MANPFSKGWKYLMQSFDSKIDENADPKVQIQQAVSGAKKQHAELTKHAANIIGNRNQLQMKLDRLVQSQQDLQNKARTALQAAEKASATGDAEKAQQFNSTAEVIASQLVSVEQELEQTTQAYSAAEQAATEAEQKQKQSEAHLQEQLGQVSQLESQYNQAKMQEQTASTLDSMNQFGGNDNVPTLDGMRDKIERRYANALGAQELAKDSITDRMQEIESGGTDIAASSRLDEIRASMGVSKASELEANSANAASTELPAASKVEAGGTGSTKFGTAESSAATGFDQSLAQAQDYVAKEAPGAVEATEVSEAIPNISEERPSN